MKNRYQIKQRRAVRQFRKLVTEQNPNIQMILMILPMADIAGLLQEGVGNLLRQAGLDVDAPGDGNRGEVVGRRTPSATRATPGAPLGQRGRLLRGGWPESADPANAFAQRCVCALLIDGTPFKDRQMIAALGIGCDGRKTVLGIREGATENTAVVSSLLSELVERGFDFSTPRLYIHDGGKALHAAVRKHAGEAAFIQRCQVHKKRNIVDHLPDGDFPTELAL